MAFTLVGAVGTAAGVTVAEGVDGALVPTSLVAVTVKAYVVPRVSPPMVVDVPAGAPRTTSPVHSGRPGWGSPCRR